MDIILEPWKGKIKSVSHWLDLSARVDEMILVMKFNLTYPKEVFVDIRTDYIVVEAPTGNIRDPKLQEM